MAVDRPFVIAIEGPSDSGKSTLAGRLQVELADVGVALLPCYVDFAGGEGSVPAGRSSTVEQQLASLRTYLELDRRRALAATEHGTPAVLLLDRSVHTLLAHATGEADTGGPDGLERCRELTRSTEDVLWPDLILYLAVDDAHRRQRMDPRDAGGWWTSADFNRGFDRYFRDLPTSEHPRLERIDGNREAELVFQYARALIRSWLAHVDHPGDAHLHSH